MRNYKKGQYFSFDAIVASIIFILTFISLVSYWFSVKSMLESKENELEKQAIRISDFMLINLTISHEDKRIMNNTLQTLSSLNYGQLKNRFNSPYNIFINITKQGKNNGMPIVVLGNAPPPKIRDIAKVRRVFILVNETYETPATLDIYLYK